MLRTPTAQIRTEKNLMVTMCLITIIIIIIIIIIINSDNICVRF